MKILYEDTKINVDTANKIDFDQFFDWFKKEISSTLSKGIIEIIFNFAWLYKDNNDQKKEVNPE